MNLSGTDCRAEENCSFSFEFGDADGGGGGFGGFSGGADGGPVTTTPDAGTAAPTDEIDAGVIEEAPDAGVVQEGSDAGATAEPNSPVDGGTQTTAPVTDGGVVQSEDGGMAPDILDGGMSIEPELGFWDTQGFPVCTRSFQCDLFDGEVCCTSDRFTAVDIGVCLPIWLCLGNTLIGGFGDDDG